MDVGALIQSLAQRLFYGELLSDQEMKDQVSPDASEDGEAPFVVTWFPCSVAVPSEFQGFRLT